MFNDNVVSNGAKWTQFEYVWYFAHKVFDKMPRILRRFSGIRTGLCAVLGRFIITCLRDLGGSTNTCRTSLDMQQMLFSCERLRLCRLSLTFALTRLRSPIRNSRQERRHGRWRMAIYYGTPECLTLRFCHLFWITSEASKWGVDHCTSVGAVRGERLNWYLCHD